MTRAALYARVSTAEQDPTSQLLELRAVAERRGWDVVAEHVDQGVSGAASSRPALDQLREDARAGRVDVVAVWALDRLFRSLPELVLTIDELGSQGVGFVAVTQGIDTTDRSPTGRLTLQVLGAVAEFERAMIRERVRAGIAKAQAQGVHCGRPAAAIDWEAFDQLRAEGASVARAAKVLGVGRSTLYAALKEREAE